MNINEVLERFKKTEYHYPDVIWHDIRSVKLKQKLTTDLVSMTCEEFKTLLLSNLFWLKSGSQQNVDIIVEGNDLNELNLKLFDLFLGVGDYKLCMELKSFKPCVVSQFLGAVNNKEYIIYHENVVNGIEDFLTHVVNWQLIELYVKNYEHYVDFNELCKSIKNNFGFKNLGELHEFFWHGHSSGWNFIILNSTL